MAARSAPSSSTPLWREPYRLVSPRAGTGRAPHRTRDGQTSGPGREEPAPAAWPPRSAAKPLRIAPRNGGRRPAGREGPDAGHGRSPRPSWRRLRPATLHRSGRPPPGQIDSRTGSTRGCRAGPHGPGGLRRPWRRRARSAARTGDGRERCDGDRHHRPRPGTRAVGADSAAADPNSPRRLATRRPTR